MSVKEQERVNFVTVLLALSRGDWRRHTHGHSYLPSGWNWHSCTRQLFTSMQRTPTMTPAALDLANNSTEELIVA